VDCRRNAWRAPNIPPQMQQRAAPGSPTLSTSASSAMSRRATRANGYRATPATTHSPANEISGPHVAERRRDRVGEANV
jgi:hypothetical protein